MINGTILNHGTTEYRSPVLEPNTRYFWRVMPFNATGQMPYQKPVWTFMSEQVSQAQGSYNPSVNPTQPVSINPAAIQNITPNILVSPGSQAEPAVITVIIGGNTPESIPNSENALAVWMQLISDIDIFPVTIEVIFNGLEFTGSIPEIIVNNGALWSNLGISNIQLLGTNPYHVRFTYNPSSKTNTAFFAFSSGNTSTLPVTLSSFNAVNIDNQQVKISWTTESESNIAGYHIYRSETNQQATSQRITNQVIPANNCSTQSQYAYQDSEIENNSTYYYWLLSYEMDGSHTQYGPISVRVNSSPETPLVYTENALKQNYPNPFNPSTSITYSIAGQQGQETHTEITIFNIKGQKVKSLFNGMHQAGKDFVVKWDGTNEKGKSTPSGIYFYQIKTDQFNEMKKMILMK
jgi:hypothetical protein